VLAVLAKSSGKRRGQFLKLVRQAARNQGLRKQLADMNAESEILRLAADPAK
jgi:hypothetical protein